MNLTRGRTCESFEDEDYDDGALRSYASSIHQGENGTALTNKLSRMDGTGIKNKKTVLMLNLRFSWYWNKWSAALSSKISEILRQKSWRKLCKQSTMQCTLDVIAEMYTCTKLDSDGSMKTKNSVSTVQTKIRDTHEVRSVTFMLVSL